MQAHTTTTAALGTVADDQVRIDHEVRTRAVTEPWRAVENFCAIALVAIRERARAVGTDDPQAATVGRQRRVGALVEQDVVVIDRAVEAQAAVHDTAAVAGAQVSGDPVVIQPVVVGTGADRDTTRARRRAGEQRVAEAGVVIHGVVVDVHPGVHLERNGRIRQHSRSTGRIKWRAQWRRRRNTRAAEGAVIHVQRRCLAVADIDAARQRAVVAEDTGVGHL